MTTSTCHRFLMFNLNGYVIFRRSLMLPGVHALIAPLVEPTCANKAPFFRAKRPPPPPITHSAFPPGARAPLNINEDARAGGRLNERLRQSDGIIRAVSSAALHAPLISPSPSPLIGERLAGCLHVLGCRRFRGETSGLRPHFLTRD